jgi:hypothetical protein
MKILKMFLFACIAMLSSKNLEAQNAKSPYPKLEVICKNNLVYGVNQTGNANFKLYALKQGDVIESTLYTPTVTTVKSLPAGNKYLTFMLSQGADRKTQAFLQWSPNKPVWQDILKRFPQKTVVAGLGVLPNGQANTLQIGDTYTLSAQQDKAGGPINLTWDVFRMVNGKKVSVASFSADVLGVKWPGDK